MSDDDGDKTFEATPEKLLKARRKGEIAKSTDLMTAAAYAGLLIALMSAGQGGVTRMGTALMVLIDQSDDLAAVIFGGAVAPLLGGLMIQIGLGLLPLFVLPMAAVMLAIIAQRALVFAPTKLAPKLSRISLFSNARNKFGRSGLFEFGKSFAKLCIYSVCLFFFLRARLPEMLSVLQTDSRLAIALLCELFLALLLVVVLVSGLIGGIDAIWQHMEHLRKNRMSRKEITDETKDAEGDPHMKQARRQKAMSIAQNQMMAEVPTADVVIVNPTHYAIALRWSRLPGEAPVCVAKGVDEIARVIRERAAEAAVPIHSDPPTARSLYATTNLNEEIDPDHYRAVAAAIRFAEAIRKKAKGTA